MESFTSTGNGDRNNPAAWGGGEDESLEIVIEDLVPLIITLESVDLNGEEPIKKEN
jgi:hypothetical protein